MKRTLSLLLILTTVFSCSKDTDTPTPTVEPTPKYSLAITAGDGGSVSTSGGTYEKGTKVTVTATPDGEFLFDKWSDGNTDNPREITVSSNLNLSASFIKKKYALTVNIEGEGTVEEEIIVQGSTSTTEYNSGTTVKLTAIPGEQWLFNSWSGDIESNDEQIELSLNSPKELNAKFFEIPFSYSAIGEGVIVATLITENGEPTGIKLSAIPSDGWRFKGWNGIVSSNESEIVISINEVESITAVFIQTMELSIEIEGQGEVQSEIVESPSLLVDKNSEVQLKAIPSEGWAFQRWEGDIESEDNPVNFIIENNISLKAIFNEIVEVEIIDSAFEQALVDYGYDDIVDGKVLLEDIEEVTSLQLNNRDINDVSILKYFSNLEVLELDNNSIQSLDISNNEFLRRISAKNNRITNFIYDFSNNVYVHTIDLAENAITSFGKVPPNVQTLNLANNNLTKFDFGFEIAPKLGALYLQNNNIAENINITAYAPVLTRLDLSGNDGCECVSVPSVVFSKIYNPNYNDICTACTPAEQWEYLKQFENPGYLLNIYENDNFFIPNRVAEDCEKAEDYRFLDDKVLVYYPFSDLKLDDYENGPSIPTRINYEHIEDRTSNVEAINLMSAISPIIRPRADNRTSSSIYRTHSVSFWRFISQENINSSYNLNPNRTIPFIRYGLPSRGTNYPNNPYNYSTSSVPGPSLGFNGTKSLFFGITNRNLAIQYALTSQETFVDELDYQFPNEGWYHITITMNLENNLSRIYVNGEKIHETSEISETIHSIVDANVDPGNYKLLPVFSASMDELLIVDFELSENEIQSLYQSNRIYYSKTRVNYIQE